MVNLDSCLCSSKRDIDHGTLEGHEHCQRLHLILCNMRTVAHTWGGGGGREGGRGGGGREGGGREGGVEGGGVEGGVKMIFCSRVLAALLEVGTDMCSP